MYMCMNICPYMYKSVGLYIKYTLLQELEYNLLDFFLYLYNFKIFTQQIFIYPAYWGIVVGEERNIMEHTFLYGEKTTNQING